MTTRALLATVTGEFFQPVRLHYRVPSAVSLRRAFRKLRCLDDDRARQRWVWLYDFEARGIRFQKSYREIPAHLHPIVIGSIYLRKPGEMLLDLRSCERAVQAIAFFDKHLSRSVAELTDASIVNRLFPADDPKLAPEHLFDRLPVTRRDPDAEARRIYKLIAGIADPDERARVAFADIEAGARQPLPEVERMPTNYYEDGLENFESVLRFRQVVAMKHWLGETDYTLGDAIKACLPPG